MPRDYVCGLILTDSTESVPGMKSFIIMMLDCFGV